MSNADLIHIFDNSTCLTKRQMKDYVSGIMTNEEAHAVEVHLNSCPMCSDAVEGLFDEKESALPVLQELNSDFLKDHFGHQNPQVHLNTIAASAAAKAHNPNLVKKKGNTRPLWRTTSIAAAMLLALALAGYYRMSRDEIKPSSQIAQELSQQEPEVASPAGEQPAQGAIAMNDVKEKRTSEQRATTTTAPLTEKDIAADAAPGGAIRNASDVASLTQAVPQAPSAEMKSGERARTEEAATPATSKITEDERKVITSDEIEKMPMRNTDAIAAKPDAHPQVAFGNSHYSSAPAANNNVTIESVAKSKRAAKAEASETPDRLEQADKLYKRKSYGDALNIYNKEMQNSDYTRKAEATLGAARCYLALGNKAKAKTLLQALADNSSGPTKRQAKRLLSEME